MLGVLGGEEGGSAPPPGVSEPNFSCATPTGVLPSNVSDLLGGECLCCYEYLMGPAVQKKL